MHDGDFSACRASLYVGRMFILCFSYLDHLAPKSRHRSKDFCNLQTLLQTHDRSVQDITHVSTLLMLFGTCVQPFYS